LHRLLLGSFIAVALQSWLPSTSTTADTGRQAAPMVLDLENVLHSTPEVLERELQLLSLPQLMQIHDAIISVNRH